MVSSSSFVSVAIHLIIQTGAADEARRRYGS
jgi:hypothetical protein